MNILFKHYTLYCNIHKAIQSMHAFHLPGFTDTA